MYQVDVYMRHYRILVTSHRFDDLQQALIGRIALLEHFRRQGVPIRVSSVRRIP
jgi:hypothetical protein